MGALPPEVFRATVIDPPLDCNALTPLKEAIPQSSTLASSSCRTANGRFFDLYTVDIRQPLAWEFTLASG